MIKVSKIDRLGGYRLRFHFSDGSVGEYDFGSLVQGAGEMVEPLRDVSFFNRVFIEDGAPTWPNGFDASPGWLHQDIANAGALRRGVVVD